MILQITYLLSIFNAGVILDIWYTYTGVVENESLKMKSDFQF